MELRQLRYLVTLADERHFTRAAALLHIAQPALSQQIRRLEDELGIALVDRTTRHVSLTAAGERLVARARRALAEVEAATAELSELSGIRTGRVVIGAMRSTGPFDLSALLAAFHALHPGVELREHAPRPRHEPLARRRERDMPRRAVDERDPELVLQPPDLLRQRRLRDVQQPGRAREVALVGQRDEVAQLAQFHHTSLSESD